MLSKAVSTINNQADSQDFLYSEKHFNYTVHGKGISAAGLICHSNKFQLKRENASIIILLKDLCLRPL